MRINDHIRNRLLKETNNVVNPKKLPTYDEIMFSNWSPEFELLMRNRLRFGYFRYGPLKDQKKGIMDNIGSIRDRINIYEHTGNDELLVDVANIAMVEYMKGDHPLKHFKSEDDGEHVQKKKPL